MDIDRANKTAVLNLIDMKIDADMKEVLNRMDMLFGKFDVQLQSLKNEIKVVYWVIGIATAIIGLMIAFKK